MGFSPGTSELTEIMLQKFLLLYAWHSLEDLDNVGETVVSNIEFQPESLFECFCMVKTIPVSVTPWPVNLLLENRSAIKLIC